MSDTGKTSPWVAGLRPVETPPRHPDTLRMASELCDALALKRCVSLKIEVDSETMIPMVTAVQYLGHDQFHALDKVLRQYRLELIGETPLPTPDVEVFLGGQVNTFRLPEDPLESDPK